MFLNSILKFGRIAAITTLKCLFSSVPADVMVSQACRLVATVAALVTVELFHDNLRLVFLGNFITFSLMVIPCIFSGKSYGTSNALPLLATMLVPDMCI